MKLNVLLAKTDQLAASFKNNIKDYIKFFKNNQSSFRGEKKTYTPKEGTIDVPSMRGNKLLVTTVKEKLDWLSETQSEFIDSLFSQEATNASGRAKATLRVGNIDFGELSSLELLRLKSIVENGEFKDMYENIPVRSDDEVWNATTNEAYLQREIFESSLMSGVSKSTMKESYILEDPNADKAGANYKPVVASKDTVLELGDYTHQKFSGEYSHRQRAEILRRRERLLTAIVEALKEANDVEAVQSNMTSQKIFNYLHSGS